MMFERLLTFLKQPFSELLGNHHPKTDSTTSQLIDFAEDTVSRVLQLEARKDRASQWQGVARYAEHVGRELQYCARTEACLDFNGDFHGVYEQDAGTSVFFLGDVSGKGLPAAFYQTSCVTLLHQAARLNLDPAEVIGELNSILAERENEERYATLLYGVFDSKSNTVTLVNAGHPMPFLMSREGDIRELQCPQGLPVGLNTDFRYQSMVLEIDPGDTLVFYSDGLSEARNGTREFLGEEGLLQLLSRFRHLPLPEMTANIMGEVENYSPKRGDDQTIVALGFGEPTLH